MEFNSAAKVKLPVKTQQESIRKEFKAMQNCQKLLSTQNRNRDARKASPAISKTQLLSLVLDRSLISQQHYNKMRRKLRMKEIKVQTRKHHLKMKQRKLLLHQVTIS